MYIKSLDMKLERITLENPYYRRVIETTPTMQLVLMSLRKNETIPSEVHTRTTQFIRVEKGEASVEVNRKKTILSSGDSIIIPPGSRHKLTAVSDVLKLYTIYSPPEHPIDRIDFTYKK